MGTNPRRDGERSFHRGYSRNPYKPGSFDAECWQRGYDEAEAAEDAERKRQREEDERWRYLPASYRALDELEKAIGNDAADKVKVLIEALIQEARS